MEPLDLWPTYIGVHQYGAAETVNPLFVRIFNTMRVTDYEVSSSDHQFYASRDDLLHRVQLDEWNDFLNFSVASVRDTSRLANNSVWPDSSVDLQIEIKGIWFQISNGGSHHDVHTHGNCSWSAVYVVDVDPFDLRTSNKTYLAMNGVTRFYGPFHDRLGGAYADYGNAYLQNSTVDFDPIPGRMIVFPSWLPHQAMPYQGERNRIIISFNAGVSRVGHNNELSRYAPS